MPSHNALSVKQFLAGKNVAVLDHTPYSPDLAPCDFFLFPKIKFVLKGTQFVSPEVVKATQPKTVEEGKTEGEAEGDGKSDVEEKGEK